MIRVKRIRIRKKRNKFILTVLSVFVALLIWQSIDIVAKYYAAKNNKGVAVASGLYFNSDKLNKEEGSTINGIEAITEDEISNLAVTTNTASWSNGSVTLPIKIQNYDSNILFNDSGLDISYQIEFKLLDVPVGATYSVIDKTDTTEHPLASKGTTYSSTGILKGGTLNADTYKIKITLNEGTTIDDYSQARVLVLAYPVAPDYLVNEEKQQYRLLGVFVGNPNVLELDIDSAAFLIEEEFNTESNNWKEIVEDSAAYIYNIKTKGEIVQDTSTVAKREIKVRWCSEYLSIDEYSEYLGTQSIQTEEIRGTNWSYIYIEVLPYTNINLTFYKNQAFMNALNDAINSAQAFHDLVNVSVVTEE